jgi:hypothetical protein
MLRVPSLPSFRSAGHRLPQAVLLPVFFGAFSARLVRGYAAAGPLALALASPRYPRCGAIIITVASGGRGATSIGASACAPSTDRSPRTGLRLASD